MKLSVIVKKQTKSVVLIIPNSKEHKLFDIINLINSYREHISICDYEFLINKIRDELNIDVQFMSVLAEITI